MPVAFLDPLRRREAWRSAFTTAALALVACGGSSEPAKDAQTEKPTPKVDIGLDLENAAPPKEEPAELPTKCSDEGGEMCVPPAAIAKRVCAAGSPEVALAMFAKGTPWVRGYLSRTTEAWDASGGPSASNKLVFDEEVLILVRRAPATGGMIVSGASGSYDVLRWSGACASLTADEVRLRVPPEPLNADIPWRKLDDRVQEALRKDEKIAKLAEDQRKECKGMSAGQANPKCEKAQQKLGKAIAAFVRRGGALPEPPKLP
jgi:hypothetical protein